MTDIFQAIFRVYHQHVEPLMVAIEHFEGIRAYRQIPSEIRNAHTHLYRYFHKSPQKQSELDDALKHLQRACLDGYKILHRLLINTCRGRSTRLDKSIFDSNQIIDQSYNHGPIENSIGNWNLAVKVIAKELEQHFENIPEQLVTSIHSLGLDGDSPILDTKKLEHLLNDFGSLLNLESKFTLWRGVRMASLQKRCGRTTSQR